MPDETGRTLDDVRSAAADLRAVLDATDELWSSHNADPDIFRETPRLQEMLRCRGTPRTSGTGSRTGTFSW